MNNLQKTLIAGLEHGIVFQVLDKETGEYENQSVSRISFPLNEVEIGNTEFDLDIFQDDDFSCKPYLRSMEDLVNPITHKGETFVPLDNLNEMIEHSQLELMYDIRGFSFQNSGETFGMVYELREVFDKLNEWNFNIHGLDPDQYIRVTEENNPYK